MSEPNSLERGAINASYDEHSVLVSIAFSLKRIADVLEKPTPHTVTYFDEQGGRHVLTQVNTTDSRNVYLGADGQELVYGTRL